MRAPTDALDEFASETAASHAPLLQTVPASRPHVLAAVRRAPATVMHSVWRGARAVALAPFALVACVVLQAYWLASPSRPAARSFGAGVCVRIRL